MKVKKQVKEELANTPIYTFKGRAERDTYSCQALQRTLVECGFLQCYWVDTGKAMSDLKKANFGRYG